MTRYDRIVRAAGGVVCWLALVAATASLVVGGIFGTYPGPYGGTALVAGALAVAVLGGALLVAGVPARVGRSR
ncbi:hypothetical protein [Halarchaeum nitratireducens]|uniref:Uncharacterized protein n=1 Tax=Halarchaeum nitratireducens TaxID=489913 RepID=A0A830G7M2_9EURY|nr:MULTISPECIES: hypothetical protein [Halarchaeum]MBP2250056.1 hypothetical protein [Halarchaeum solikamskense]GGN08774.1 hypothetical protein GCM10009021_05260 [Halarchaeum nitratireducens]